MTNCGKKTRGRLSNQRGILQKRLIFYVLMGTEKQKILVVDVAVVQIGIKTGARIGNARLLYNVLVKTLVWDSLGFSPIVL